MLRTIILACCALALGTAAGKAPRQSPRSLTEVITGSWAERVRMQRLNPPMSNVSFITQRLDNFNQQNNATFQQRYISKMTHYRSGGPLYVIFSSLGPVSAYELESKLIGQIARREGGALFALENRYYGNSIPTENLSVENLQYLTVEQALADAANFVTHIRTSTPGASSLSPVIVLGRHYGGSLAVWFRQKYPHLSSAVWASSAPLLALQNHQQFKVNAAAAIRELAGDQCYQAIDTGFRDLEAMALAGRLAELSKLLNVCDQHPLETQNDVASVFLLLSEYFSSISSFRYEVRPVCYDMIAANNGTLTPGEALVMGMGLTPADEEECVHIDYEAFIQEVKREAELNSTTAYLYGGLRQIAYQLCTQLGWWSTSESPDQPFGSFYPLAFYTEMCTRVFGEAVAGHAVAQANQNRFNIEHGGINPSISNALFTHGSYDAARSIEVTRDLTDSAIAIQIPDAGAYYDFYQIESYDDQSLIEAKLDIMAVIRSWSRQ